MIILGNGVRVEVRVLRILFPCPYCGTAQERFVHTFEPELRIKHTCNVAHDGCGLESRLDVSVCADSIAATAVPVMAWMQL
jgi:hypothetical protein